MSESPEWKCVCGTLVPDLKEHQPGCDIYALHARECYCRGYGGSFEHEIKPQTPGHITVLWRCNECPRNWVPLEVPVRSRGVDVTLWMNVVNPRLYRCRQQVGCPHQLCDLMIPVDEAGKNPIGSAVPPAG